MEAFGRLLDIMDRLREECPWNHAQTVETLRPMTIEEVYELSDAVLRHSGEELKKELGDVLWHVVFYSKIAEEEGRYDAADVIEKVCEKMVFRHPHVFSGNGEKMTPEEVSENWEMIKTREKGGNKRVLSGIPASTPSVLKALSMQDKARGVGFDWGNPADVWEKVKEEAGECQVEIDALSREEGHVDPAVMSPDKESSEAFKKAYYRAEGEFGDLMFSLINAARLYGVNPDTALQKTCAKFQRRFTYLEEETIRKGRRLSDMTLAEMDAIWNEAKTKGL